MLFAEGEFAGGIGVSAEALVGTGEEQVGVGVGGIAANGLFEVMGGEFEVALLEEDAAELQVGAGRVRLGGLREEGGGLRETALAEEKGTQIDAGIDAGIVGRLNRQGDGAAEVAFGVRIATEGDIVEAGRTMDAGRGRGESKIERLAGEFVLSEGVPVAGEKVAAINRRLFELAGAEEGGFGFGEAIGGDVREAEAAPGGGVGFRFGEEEKEDQMPDHGAYSIAPRT